MLTTREVYNREDFACPAKHQQVRTVYRSSLVLKPLRGKAKKQLKLSRDRNRKLWQSVVMFAEKAR